MRGPALSSRTTAALGVRCSGRKFILNVYIIRTSRGTSKVQAVVLREISTNAYISNQFFMLEMLPFDIHP
jgi:hypothetical protein